MGIITEQARLPDRASGLLAGMSADMRGRTTASRSFGYRGLLGFWAGILAFAGASVAMLERLGPLPHDGPPPVQTGAVMRSDEPGPPAPPPEILQAEPEPVRQPVDGPAGDAAAGDIAPEPEPPVAAAPEPSALPAAEPEPARPPVVAVPSQAPAELIVRPAPAPKPHATRNPATRTEAGAPPFAAANATAGANQRCRSIVQRAVLGEELANEDRAFLRGGCKDR